jgi:hypothetical protein
MGSKARKNQQQLEEELEYHIASDWADFRRFAPNKETVLQEAVLHFSEGPFWGQTIPSVPAWYLDYLCSGGENFLLWKDDALAIALSTMGYRKVDNPPLKAPSIPPVASLLLWPKIASQGPLNTTSRAAAETDRELMPPPPRPSSAACTFDYSALASLCRDPIDRFFLLDADNATVAAAQGPGLHLQSDIDVSFSSTTVAEDVLTTYSGAGHTTQLLSVRCSASDTTKARPSINSRPSPSMSPRSLISP